jgi:hypothetical protein
MSDEITFDDCCRIILEQGAPVCQPVGPDKPNYRRDLLALLNKEFSIEWNDTNSFQNSPVVWDAEGNPWNEGAPVIGTSLVRHYGEIPDPFSGYLEYTFAKGEMEVWKAHQAGIGNAATAMKQRLVALFRDLLLLRWPKAAHRTTSWARLRALGLIEPAHDPDDF